MGDVVSPYQDKVVVITGAASGLGKSLADSLASAGAIVCCWDRKESDSPDGVEEESGGMHGRWWRVDVGNPEEIRDAMQDVVTAYGRIDYCFHCAGILIAGEFLHMSAEQCRRIAEINLLGVAYCCLEAYKIMAQQKSGHIVNIASISGLVANPLYAGYSMTKHGVVGLSKALREEAKQFGVRVTSVCPGTLRTQMFSTGEVVGAAKQTIFKDSILAAMTPNDAASLILKKVPRNPPVIVFPFYCKAIWGLERFCSTALSPMNQAILRRFRSLQSAH